MSIPERRLYPRQEAHIEVTVHKNDEKIPATLIDMSKGGIAIISDRDIPPGTEVKITVNFIDDYFFRGTVKWVQLHDEIDKKTMYRIGIAADRIIATEDIL
jgi:hypothetical protein